MCSGNGVGAVPTGLRNVFLEFLFPTLKRGANKHCAYGANALALRKVACKTISFVMAGLKPRRKAQCLLAPRFNVGWGSQL